MARSRPAKPIVANTAKMEVASNPSSPGRRIRRTPTKPIPIANQRRQPTFSAKKITAPSATTSGVACKMAEAVDRGVKASAKAKKRRPQSSKTVLTMRARDLRPGWKITSPARHVRPKKITNPPKPNRITEYAIEACSVAALNNISSSAKAAMASTI